MSEAVKGVKREAKLDANVVKARIKYGDIIAKKMLFTRGDNPYLFYGYILVQLKAIFTRDIPTLGVSKDLTLYINPEFFLDKIEDDADEENVDPDDMRKSIIIHEILHIAFKHLTRDEGLDRHRFNVAADVAINQLIEGLCDYKKSGVHHHQYSLSGNQTSEWYYGNLPENIKTRQIHQGADGKWYDQDGNEVSDEDVKNAKDGSCQGMGKGGKPIGDHGKWGENKKEDGTASNKSNEDINGEIDAIMREAADHTEKNRGTIPGAFESIIAKLREAKPIPWEQVFRRLIANGLRLKHRFSRTKLDRRKQILPSRQKLKTFKIMACIDTSGSMCDEEIAKCFNEILYMDKMPNTSLQIEVMEIDARVHRVYKFKKIPQGVAGRGGTAFEPAFEWVHKERHDKIDLMIYLTDGWGSFPAHAPKYGVIWVVTPGQNLDKHHFPFGKVVQMR